MRGTRLSTVEYGTPTDLVGSYVDSSGLPRHVAEKTVLSAFDRASTVLRLNRPIVETTRDGLRVAGVAGILELDAVHDLEILPKYASSGTSGWASDLLFISMLSKYGELLTYDRVGSSLHMYSDLASLTARVILRLYYRNWHTPLKSRRRDSYYEFALDGEFDAVNVVVPTDEGFEQEQHLFDVDNEYSATIVAGVRALTERVRDPQLSARLRQMLSDVGRTKSRPSRFRKRLPQRLRRWQLLYDLGFDLARGVDLGPGYGHHVAMGFIVDTWRVWQDLMTRCMTLAFGFGAVSVQRSQELGKRKTQAQVRSVRVTPDLVVLTPLGVPMIVDAKYKGKGDAGFIAIEESDLYESIAFMRATQIPTTLLLYPATERTAKSTGWCWIAEEICVGSGERVLAGCVEINGIAKRGGLGAVVTGLRTLIMSLTAGASTPGQ